jgi:glycosyltransferase involved in cell wall biosynthesis
MKKPVVLQISIEVNSGSVGRISEQIGEKAIELGWESYITFARNNNSSKSQLIKIGSNIDVCLHGLETRIFDNHGLGSRIATRRLISKIKSIRPDIIHLHHLHGYYINIKILFDYLSSIDIPIVWTFHDCWSFTGHCAFFSSVGCDKWKTECHNCEQKAEYPKSLVFDRSRKNYLEKKKIFNSVKNLTIITVSDWLRDIVKDSFHEKYPIRRIYNGVDTNVFFPKKTRGHIEEIYGTKGKYIILGVASTWEKRKGLRDFIRLNELLPTDDFVIVLIGLDKNQIKNLPSSIVGIERTESVEALVDFYSEADLYINLSREETFGLTTVEAMACGTPVIVYNSTVCPEIIDESVGVVVEVKDFCSLVKAVFFIKDKGKLQFQNVCREKVISLYDKEKNMAKYVDLYNELLLNIVK